MQYTDVQISAIKLFGRKDLTEGCIVFQPEYDYTFKIPEDEGDLMVAMRNGFRWTTILEISESKVGFEILGHEPHLEDLFRVAGEKERGFVLNDESLFIFGEEIPYISYKPLLDQPSLPDILNLFEE